MRINAQLIEGGPTDISGRRATTGTSTIFSRCRMRSPDHCGPAQGEVAARRKTGARANTDGQYRGLYLLSARPPDLPHCVEGELPDGAAVLCPGDRARCEGYARAYAGIAVCDVRLQSSYGFGLIWGVDGILATAEKALAIDPSLSEARAARAFALSLGDRRTREKAAARTPYK